MTKFVLFFYWLLGRRRFWQYYTNVTWSTCAECLKLHGRIAPDPARFPQRRDGCPREILPFSVWQLPEYKEKARRMRELAQAELERRRLFARAVEVLERDPEEALSLFDRAGGIELYLPEVERLAEEKREFFLSNPQVKKRLGEIFLKRWSEKFGKPRYEVWPERMRIEREKWGERRIRELFLQV